MGTRKSGPATSATGTERAAERTARTRRPGAQRVLASATSAAPVLMATAKPASGEVKRAHEDAPSRPVLVPFDAHGVAHDARATRQRHQPRRQHFGDLREALAAGWEIVQPIFARPLWSTPDDSKTAFNFVLANAQRMRLVTVPEGRTVERFIHTRHLSVDYAR